MVVLLCRLEAFSVSKFSAKFSGAIVIKPKDIAEEETKNIYKPEKANLDLIIWLDGSKLETESVRTGIALKQGKT
jgi:hypothetical protein